MLVRVRRANSRAWNTSTVNSKCCTAVASRCLADRIWTRLINAAAILKAGYERIGFMGTKLPLDHRARKRFEGFTEALAKSGVEIEDREFYSGGSALAKGREMTATMLPLAHLS